MRDKLLATLIVFGLILGSAGTRAQVSAPPSTFTVGTSCTGAPANGSTSFYLWPTSDGSALGCNGSTWVNVPLKAGYSTAACSSSIAGAIMFNSSTSKMSYCNGSAWTPFSSSPGFVPAYTVFTAASLAKGGYTSCALKSTGVLWCWGSNTYGQLGTADTNSRRVPTQSSAAFAGPWSFAGVGSSSTCAIKSSDSSLWCWGNNTYGQIGDGTTTNRTTSPVQISGTWLQVSGGGFTSVTYGATNLNNQYYTCGVQTDNSGWCWGANDQGELGDGTTTQRLSPVQVSGSWKTIVAGNTGFHTCGIKTDNSLWCWGYNGYGQMGIGTTTDATTPQQVAGSWSSIAVGGLTTCGIQTDGSLWCWGYNANYSVGDNTTTERNSPVQISGTWLAVAFAGSSSNEAACAIKNDNTLWCWGDNKYGEANTGSVANSVRVPTAVVMAANVSGSNWVEITGGNSAACARRDDNTVYCWGLPTYEQLGDPNGAQYYVPVSGS